MPNADDYSPRYSVGEYQHWKGDWELWKGIAIAMPPSPCGKHQLVLTELAGLVRNAICEANCDARTVVELDWIIGNDTVVRPDVMLICGEPPESHLEQAPAIVMEVLSDSTRENDLGYKRNLYRQQGVAAYVIVDPQAQVVLLDRRQLDGSYRSETVDSEVSLVVCDGCLLKFSVETVFR